jgi:D-alanyl-D-alanine dipeptidase
MSREIILEKPQDIVDIKTIIHDISVDLAYASKKNFTGTIIPGYQSSKAYLTKDAISALLRVQTFLLTKGLGLHVFDAYRPNKSVLYFCNTWAQSTTDCKKLKEVFYPNKSKIQIIQEGFIATESSHSYGSTIDLTIIDIQTKELIDMGGFFDLFDELSFTDSKDITKEQQQNRLMLKDLMEKNGFINYKKEWWHFRFLNGPYYKIKIFDFDIV